MEEFLVYRLEEYKKILEEGTEDILSLELKHMSQGICNWSGFMGYRLHRVLTKILKRNVLHKGIFFCPTPKMNYLRGLPVYENQENRIKVLKFIIKYLKDSELPWYKRIFKRRYLYIRNAKFN